MKLYVLTYRRPSRQLTLSFIPEVWRKHTIIVCDSQDRRTIEKSYPVEEGWSYLDWTPWVEAEWWRAMKDAGGEQLHGLTPKRAGCIRHAQAKGYDKVMQFDDDLRFSARIGGSGSDSAKLRIATERDLDVALCRMRDDLLERAAHAAWSIREGNNRVPEGGVVENSRCLRAMAYRTDVLDDEDLNFGRVLCRADYDMTLQLLRRGYENLIDYDIANDQREHNEAGGVSLYRTDEVSAREAHRLAEIHPGFVRVFEKEYDYGLATRTEVTCYWKKAYKAADLMRDEKDDE